MAGRKPSGNHFGLLDRSDPGDKRLNDLDAAKSTATPALSLTQELFGNAYPSARDYIIRQSELARAKLHAAGPANKVQADGANRGGYNDGSSRQQQQEQRMSGGYKSYKYNGVSRRKFPGAAAKKVPAQGVEAPPAAVQAPPPPPPSLYDINEFPSLLK